MTRHFTVPVARGLYKRITREAPHILAVVILRLGDGYCYVVVDGASGDCLAWDGTYYDDDMPQTTPLGDLNWDDWDDMSSKYVLATQREWLAGPLGLWLMPTYSVAKAAAELVSTWSESGKGDIDVGSRGEVVCYVPIFDHDSYEHYLAQAQHEKEQIAARLNRRGD